MDIAFFISLLALWVLLELPFFFKKVPLQVAEFVTHNNIFYNIHFIQGSFPSLYSNKQYFWANTAKTSNLPLRVDFHCRINFTCVKLKTSSQLSTLGHRT